MLKHVVKHNNRRAALLYRRVPGEDHMCLLVYSDLLPRMIHDEIMKVLESAPGQQANDLADALFRNIMPDGRNTLQVLHAEGMIQKVPCNQVIVQANAKSTVRLDELNDILDEMAKGQEAVQRLAELDHKVTGWKPGMQEREAAKPKAKVVEGREVGAPPNAAKPAEVLATDGILSDADIAQNLLVQAQRMQREAESLMAEVQRLTKEASALTPGVKVKKTNGAKTKVKAN
jgi:hypothetical protein